MIVSVLVEVNVNKINKTFDYNVPDLLKKGTKESDCDYIKKKYSMEG